MIRTKEVLGGGGIIVEIDESNFGKRKHNRRKAVDRLWIFGSYECGSRLIFMVPIEDRKASTLIPLIKKWIWPCTTIISDCWNAYDSLVDEGHDHKKVNQLANFKDLITSTHTNAIKSSWRAVEASCTSSGWKHAHVAGNLARYMFGKWCGERHLDPVVEFLHLAGTLYNGTKQMNLVNVEVGDNGDLTSGDDEDITSVGEDD